MPHVDSETLASDKDWRVRLSLPTSNGSLYNDAGSAVMHPLKKTNGLIFPYTPTISTQYTASYESYQLIHSNYLGYFYKGSSIQSIVINGTFTAQDAHEAEYMLAGLHFLRSATKMFYGQDSQRGTPPPVLLLSGFGKYQYNNNPCVVSLMSYNLPNDVDYIATDPIKGSATDVFHYSASTGRLVGAGLAGGGGGGSNSSEKTYVPTKIDVNITLLPVQTRKQVSTEFSLKDYASGTLLTKGFW